MEKLYKVGDEVKVFCSGSAFDGVTGNLLETRGPNFWLIERNDGHGPFVFEAKYLIPRDWASEESEGEDRALFDGAFSDNLY